MIFEALMTGLLAWQIWMPAVDNGKFMFQVDRDGTIIRMNTQDGSMERCTSDFRCEAQKSKESNSKDDK